MGDTSIILKNFISDSYTIGQPPKAQVDFDTKFARMDKFNHIIVENMPKMYNKKTLGGNRFAVEDVKRIQVFCSRPSAINDRFLIETHLMDIINANPLGMQSSGVQQAFITQFSPIITQTDAKTNEGEVETTAFARSYALCTLYYDLTVV